MYILGTLFFGDYRTTKIMEQNLKNINSRKQEKSGQ